MASLTALTRLSLACILVIISAACIGGPAPAPTPDPFAGLAERADRQFQDGLKAFEEGRYREAVNAFEQARLLSPLQDARIEQMIERSRAALNPTPTPEPVPPTAVPATPTPTVTVNASVPDVELGERYFGRVFLTVVPGRRGVIPPPLNEFYYEDQVGLYIEALDQRLRMPFMLRVFDLDTGRLVAQVRNEGSPPTPVSGLSRSAAPQPTAVGAGTVAANRTPGPSVAETPGPASAQLVRFWENFVWYHEGGEPSGRFRTELYANGTLTHAFDYLVGTVPIALPAVPLPSADAVAGVQPAIPGVPGAPDGFDATGGPVSPEVPVPPGPSGLPAASEPAPDIPRAARPVAAAPASRPAAPAEPPPPPTPTPLPTATPAPDLSSSTIGGIPAGLDVNPETNRVYVADASGVVWTVDKNQPTLSKPFQLDQPPVDLAVDPTTDRLFISAKSAPAVLVLNGASGQRLASIPLPVEPGDIELDASLGLLYVVLPGQQALTVIDVRSGNMVRSTTGLSQVTGLVLDRETHVLYLSHLSGQVSSIDGRTGEMRERFNVSTAGLSGISTAGGLVQAINTATKELLVVDPATGDVSRFALPEEPGAITAGGASGAVYVLGARTNAVLQVDPSDGAVVGSAPLPERSGNYSLGVQRQRDVEGLHARIALNRAEDTVFVTQPEMGSLSVIDFPRFVRTGEVQVAAARAAAPAPGH